MKIIYYKMINTMIDVATLAQIIIDIVAKYTSLFKSIVRDKCLCDLKVLVFAILLF